MKKEIFISMEKEVLKGNVLDVGLENYGIIYHLYKQNNEEGAVEYCEGRKDKDRIEEGIYDSCVLFFGLSTLWAIKDKQNLIKDIHRFLKEEGVLYIWDMDKDYFRTFHANIKVSLPNNITKEISIKDGNPLKSCTKEKTFSLLEEYFDIMEMKTSDDIYSIICKKKGRKTNEDTLSGN